MQDVEPQFPQFNVHLIIVCTSKPGMFTSLICILYLLCCTYCHSRNSRWSSENFQAYTRFLQVYKYNKYTILVFCLWFLIMCHMPVPYTASIVVAVSELGIYVEPRHGSSWQKCDAFKISCVANPMTYFTAGWSESLRKPRKEHDNRLQLAQGGCHRMLHWLKDEANFLGRGKEAVIALRMDTILESDLQVCWPWPCNIFAQYLATLLFLSSMIGTPGSTPFTFVNTNNLLEVSDERWSSNCRNFKQCMTSNRHNNGLHSTRRLYCTRRTCQAGHRNVFDRARNFTYASVVPGRRAFSRDLTFLVNVHRSSCTIYCGITTSNSVLISRDGWDFMSVMSWVGMQHEDMPVLHRPRVACPSGVSNLEGSAVQPFPG